MTPLMVRDLAESMGVKGIGYYPVSGFVHVDVRDQFTTWTDYGRDRQDTEGAEHGPEHGEQVKPEAKTALSERRGPRISAGSRSASSRRASVRAQRDRGAVFARATPPRTRRRHGRRRRGRSGRVRTVPSP